IRIKVLTSVGTPGPGLAGVFSFIGRSIEECVAHYRGQCRITRDLSQPHEWRIFRYHRVEPLQFTVRNRRAAPKFPGRSPKLPTLDPPALLLFQIKHTGANSL